jgi:hypothetical protein
MCFVQEHWHAAVYLVFRAKTRRGAEEVRGLLRQSLRPILSELTVSSRRGPRAGAKAPEEAAREASGCGRLNSRRGEELTHIIPRSPAIGTRQPVVHVG